MEAYRTKTCGMAWCSNPIAKITIGSERTIQGIKVCRLCYQYVWEQAKAGSQNLKTVVIASLTPPQRSLPNIATTCARKNCEVKFLLGEGAAKRRHIGLLHVCRSCYQKTWEMAKEKGITLEEAWKLLPPKGWKPQPPEPVKCSLPWCNNFVKPREKWQFGENIFACGNCRMWLCSVAKRRYKGTKTWQELGLDAIKGILHGPGTAELCAMPWCSTREVTHRRGPNGEPICNTDGVYLYLYSRRHGISIKEAFGTAPQPQAKGPRRVS